MAGTGIEGGKVERMSQGPDRSVVRRASGPAAGRTSSGYSRARRPRRGIRLRFSVLAALYLLLTTSVAAAVVHVIRAHSRPAVLLSGGMAATPKYLVLIVLDGARPDYFGMTSLPHADALRADGTQFSEAFDGILESETPTGHTTIATGSSPARNGILGFEWAQNDNDYSIFSPAVVNSGAMEHIMAASGVPTIAGLYKQKYPGARVVALSGHKYYAADPMGGPQADAIMYYQGDQKGRYVPVAIPGHVPPAGILTDPSLIAPTIHLAPGAEDTLATNLAIKTFQTMHQRITLINYPEFDWPLGHVDGGNLDPAAVVTLMKNFDTDLGHLEDAYRQAGVLGQTLFVITADHGMQPLTRFIPQTVITNAVSAAGTSAPAISYSTGTYVWLADGSKAQTVAQNILNAKDPGVQSAYYLVSGAQPHYALAGGTFADAGDDRANQYLLATLINGHEPDVVVFARTDQSFSATSTGWKADHGGASWQAQHIPLIISGPGVRTGQIVAQPAQLEDVAPTVLRILGVNPTGMEGHVLTEAQNSPSAADTRARAQEVSTITPLANALIAEDRAEASAK